MNKALRVEGGYLTHFILFYFIFLAMLRGLQDLSSPTRDRTCAPCSGSSES